MTKSVLIIGYGRAGKRHAKMAENLGLTVFKYDPYIWPQQRGIVWSAIKPDAVVIATPPETHLHYIRLCFGLDPDVDFDFNLPVLCEKPLCALGQLDEAKALLDHPQVHRLMIAYNWRYHPKLKQSQKSFDNGLFLDCWQFRDNLPDWGLLLDHCSHDLDILRFTATDEIAIKETHHYQGQNMQTWEIMTTVGRIRESVTYVESKRIANLYYAPGRYIELDPLPEMYTDMWKAFLRGDYRPGLLEAIKTQELLEKCHQLNGENKNGLFKSKLDQAGRDDSTAAK